jgi:hypothetical protein
MRKPTFFLRLFLPFLLLMLSSTTFPLNAEAYCERASWGLVGFNCLLKRPTHCDPPIDHLCCDTSDECVRQNPYCNPNDPTSGIRTGLGCLHATNPVQFINQVVTWSIGAAGGVAFLIIIYGAFLIATAGGDPKHVTQGRELITSAIFGLFLIVCAIVILNTIGLKLNLPNMGFNI